MNKRSKHSIKLPQYLVMDSITACLCVFSENKLRTNMHFRIKPIITSSSTWSPVILPSCKYQTTDSYMTYQTQIKQPFNALSNRSLSSCDI